MRVALALLIFVAGCWAQSKRVLYITHSAGFRHDSIPASIEAMRAIAVKSGSLEVVPTEDLSMLTRGTLRNFDAVFFYTSGELPISTEQKQDLLSFVREGGGFGGAHSATDTFYSWPEYGELIGARFDGHPWVQEVRADIEDPAHPAVRDLVPGFSITDEIYQFREFSRSRIRVLLSLDTASVNIHATGVNRTDGDFPLAWVQPFGNGRVFYTALGHFEGTWQNERFRNMLMHALLWITHQEPGDATPRGAVMPSVLADGIGNAASLKPAMAISPGSIVSIFGSNLTPGSAAAADYPVFRYKLAGTVVRLNGVAVPLLYASPGQINAYVPPDLAPSEGTYSMVLSQSGVTTASIVLAHADTTPGLFTWKREGRYLTVWATGLGAVERAGSSFETAIRPIVTVGGVSCRILYSGMAPGVPGLYQINVELPEPSPGSEALLRFGSFEQRISF